MWKLAARIVIGIALPLCLCTVGGSLSRQKRVIGGHPIERKDRPWLVSLKSTVNGRHHYCGGTLLNDRWVLTAAHCFIDPKHNFRQADPQTWQARLALNRLDSTWRDRTWHMFGKMFGKLEWQLWERNFQRIVVHPQYGYSEKKKWYNDIALVELQEGVPSGDEFEHIKKIKLPVANDHSFPRVRQVCMVVGWGCTRTGGPMSQIAMSLRVPIMPMRVCNSFYTPYSFIYSPDRDHRLCAGYHFPAFTGGICRGDSGSPLLCKYQAHGEWVQVGVVSFTRRDNPQMFPAVYTRVSDFMDWITNTTHLVGGSLSRQKRVIGGRRIERRDRPWLVSLKSTINDNHHYCGGTLLNDRWVLTAAHCFNDPSRDFKETEPQTWQARLALNSLDFSWRDRSKHIIGKIFGKLDWQLWERNVKQIIVHPQYGYTENRRWFNDIALVELQDGVPSGDEFKHIAKITLPVANDRSFPRVGQNCTVVGWGCTRLSGPMSQIAMSLRLPIQNISLCDVKYTPSAGYTNKTDHRLCAGYQHPDFVGGTCRGDSGSPLLCKHQEQGEWVQVGVASYAMTEDPKEQPAVFTRVSDFMYWITNTTHYYYTDRR